MEPKIVTLPMFPLSTIVLPGETKMLHIFEEKYKELIADCLHNSATFGIPYIQKDNLTRFGMEVKIKRVVKKFDNGELEIMIEGIAPFKILCYTDRLSPDKPYGAASIEENEGDMTSSRYKMFRTLKKFLKVSKGKEIPVESLSHVPVYNVASQLDLTNEEKLQLISFAELKQKEDFLIAKLKLFLFMYKTERELNGRYWMN